MKKKEVTMLLTAMALSMTMTGCGSSKLNVVNEKVTVEYGSEVSLEASDYLDNKDKVLKAVEVESELEKVKGYPEVGEYTIEFAYKKQNAEVVVSVVDTTKPKFVDFKDTVETYQNSKVDFNALYLTENSSDKEITSVDSNGVYVAMVKDLSEVEVAFDDSQVNYSVGGSYTATVTATDKHGNAETKEVTVNVLPVEVSLDNSSTTVNVGSTVQLNATTNVEGSKATFTSSDSNIATVDENGLVTGVAKGNATITAEVNGIKAECVVSVNAVKTTTSNKNNGSSNKNNGTTNNSGSNNSNSNNGSQTVVVVPSAPTTATPQTSREAFDLINAERAKLGLQPAVWSTKCEQIALQRGSELAQLSSVNSSNAHNGFDKFQNEDLSLGECVAWGYGSANGAVNGWMNSSGHKATLMRENRVYLAVVQVGNRWVAINSWSETAVAW